MRRGRALVPCRSVGLGRLRRALSPMRFPRLPPLTMLGPNDPLHSCGCAPNIVKNGTPQKGRVRQVAFAPFSDQNRTVF